nr:hypothetical protein Iba_chr01aCG17500 [Ipomoea batatas]
MAILGFSGWFGTGDKRVGVVLLHKGFLIAIVDDVRPFPFSGVHDSCLEISDKLLVNSPDIVVANDGGFNRGNSLHPLGVITGRVAELHATEVFLVTPFNARGQYEIDRRLSEEISKQNSNSSDKAYQSQSMIQIKLEKLSKQVNVQV